MLLFFQTTSTDLAWYWGIAFAVLVGAGTLAKALYDLNKYGFQFVKKRYLTPWKASREQQARLLAIVERWDSEFSTNGGASMKDMLVRIDRRVDYLQAFQRFKEETSNQPSFELDAKGNLTKANAALCEILDVDEKNLLYRDWVSRARQGERQILNRDLEDAIQYKMPLDSPIVFNVGGKIVPLRLRAQPYVKSGGELVGFFGSAELISEQE
ncbi:MAG: PAS domain-containing protein [Pyrinomonadaceae bacterium]